MESHKPSLEDPRLSTLREELLSLEERLDPFPEERDDRIHAAVSVILRVGEKLEILLIKRAEAEGDPWSGQMALPGGRRDPTDPTLLHTALRETAEETGLILEGIGVHLGRLEPVIPATTRLPPITIFPYVFGVGEGARAEASSREVDEVLWVPLVALLDRQATSTVEIHYGDNSSRVFPCLRVDDRVVWGLTYRILTGFFELFQAGQTLG
ncbi:MAG: CoA pyrophosphatase [Gemmatimonadales bacterium]|nr:MAG: CoA pyrophosphatase [Gemmatimonadales bacterium]